jgi:type I restriction enzyme M protein
MMDLSTLETWLWDAACAIRGPVDAAKFKDTILPLVFLKRLSDVFDDEVAHLRAELGVHALRLVEQDHKLVRFYQPATARWDAIRTHAAAGLGQYLTDAVRAVARANPRLQGVIDMVDFNATAAGQRIVLDDYLARLIEEAARNDYNLFPSRYVSTDGAEETLPLGEAMVLLREAEEERAAADARLHEVLNVLGLGGLYAEE